MALEWSNQTNDSIKMAHRYTRYTNARELICKYTQSRIHNCALDFLSELNQLSWSMRPKKNKEYLEEREVCSTNFGWIRNLMMDVWLRDGLRHLFTLSLIHWSMGWLAEAETHSLIHSQAQRRITGLFNGESDEGEEKGLREDKLFPPSLSLVDSTSKQTREDDKTQQEEGRRLLCERVTP